MKTGGRGRDYKKALLKNLVRHLAVYKKITTTRTKALLLKRRMGAEGNALIMTRLPNRLGDNAPQVLIELITHDENRADKGKTHTKSVASH